MNLPHRFLRAALTLGAALSLGAFNAQAGPTLLVEDGVLVGAKRVMVGLVAYDVRLVDGSCVGLYEGCNAPTDFVFDSRAEANAASAALLREVLVNGPGGNFDSDPSSVEGCNATRCSILTPFQQSRGRIAVSIATNTTSLSRDRNSRGRVPASRDTATNARSTFAVWSIHVPETDAEDGDGNGDGNGTGSGSGTGTGTGTGTGSGTDPGDSSGPVRFAVFPAAPNDGPGTQPADPIPEPGVLALLALALPAMAWTRRRGKASAPAAI